MGVPARRDFASLDGGGGLFWVFGGWGFLFPGAPGWDDLIWEKCRSSLFLYHIIPA